MIEMRILKITVSGFRLLSDNFSVDFLMDQRNKRPAKDPELTSVSEKIYIPLCHAFIGNNGVGKTTILELLYYCYSFLYSGKIAYKSIDFHKDRIFLQIYFSHDMRFYFYETYICPPKMISIIHENYCILEEQKLYTKHIRSNEPKRFFHGRYARLFPRLKAPSEVAITANLPLHVPALFYIQSECDSEMLYKALELFRNLDADERDMLVDLFKLPFRNVDLSIGKDQIRIWMDRHWTLMSLPTLATILSQGTIRGLYLYEVISFALKEGDVVFVDEIEHSIPLDFVKYLLNLFIDRDINRKKAMLLFTTYNADILNCFRRYDNIHVVRKSKDGEISVKKLFHCFAETQRCCKSAMLNGFVHAFPLEWSSFANFRKMLMEKIKP